ncbi:hypothetical protein L0F63_006512 [Massospora cicadina]|nr:hypothetical protein L0F63_006512 [Massospora cicadina]
MKLRLAGSRLPYRSNASPVFARKANLVTEARKNLDPHKASSPDETKCLIIGGGSAGIGVSATLARSGNLESITVVDPSPVHSYQPLWTFVGAGLKPLAESQKPMSEVIPPKVQWIKEKAVLIEPRFNRVVLGSGRKLRYEYLVVAPGIELRWDKVAGLEDALGRDGVTSNYSDKYVEKTWEFLQKAKGGNAIFTMPSTPIKCAGAPQKIAYLAECHFRERGVRDKVKVSYYTGLAKIFSVEKYAEQLALICKERHIETNFMHELVEVDAVKKVAIFQKLGGDKKVEVPYSFLHVTPPMGPYSFVKASGLANPEGWVDVDKEMLVHTQFKNVFSLGDASSCPTSKTAAAVTAQTGVLASNLLNTIEQVNRGIPVANISTEAFKRYDGYTSCPLLTGNNQIVLAEFSGYTGQPQETMPYNQAIPSSMNYHLTSAVIPRLYWDGLLKGIWHGPARLRKLFNQ